MDIFNVILKMYFPIIVFIVLLVFILKAQHSESSTKFTLSFFGLINTELPVKQIIMIKSILVLAITVLLIGYYLIIDFTQFYPQKLRMTVHFDKKGLKELYDEIGVKEIDGLNIDLYDDSTKRTYIEASDKTLNEKFKFKNFFSKALLDSTATMTTEGHTTFVVKKEGGLQNYYIEEANGELTHSLYEPKQNVKIIKTSFSKTVSENDKIHFNFIATFFGKRIIISPLFTENLIISTKEGSKENIELNHFLYGVTTLKVSPFPSFSNTMYLYRTKSKLVPICYAIYIED